MPETRTVITVDGTPLTAHQLELVQSVSVEESLGSPDKASVTVAMDTDNNSAWNSSLDALVAPATPFAVRVSRGGASYEIDARSVSANWNFAPGGLSTLTVEGMDRSVEMDRRDVQRLWQDTTDSTIAQTLFTQYGLAAQVESTPAGMDSATYSPQQSATDWAFLQGLAGRNGFDLHVESIGGVVTGVFKRIDPTAAAQTTIRLGYGELGGRATASVQLLAGQEVHLTRTVPGTTDTDVASDPGTGHAMGPRSLGGATLIRTHAAAGISVLDAQTTATAMAERSAFGASLSTTLTAPDMPLVRARRTITVAGLGPTLDGLWLVKSARHTITAGGHSQALGLIRNALGSGSAGAGGLAALAAGVAL
ncbi:phage late control D family protein [Micromonospora deserti]|uniref:phage late control D family protein n=1 Tax=Micromonospora deserti TaxID=2070366 RepID=UPI000DA75AC3|nr:phage late control D family protein [Micromonospora deserti]